MKRTTIFLEPDLLRELKRLAARRNVSFATVVREAAAAYIAKPSTHGALPSFAGKFASGKKTTSARVDQLLWKSPHG